MAGALRELARVSGKDFRTVVRNETEKILEGAARRTSMAQAKDIKAAQEAKGWKNINGKLYKLSHKYPDATWAMIKREQKRSLVEKLKVRGLARKIWLQIAQELNLTIKVAGQVRKATTKKGDYPIDASGSETGSGSGYTIQGTSLRNYAPGIVRALSGAIRGRLSFFKTNMRKGVFKKAKDIAAKYPGLYVNGR